MNDDQVKAEISNYCELEVLQSAHSTLASEMRERAERCQAAAEMHSAQAKCLGHLLSDSPWPGVPGPIDSVEQGIHNDLLHGMAEALRRIDSARFGFDRGIAAPHIREDLAAELPF